MHLQLLCVHNCFFFFFFFFFLGRGVERGFAGLWHLNYTWPVIHNQPTSMVFVVVVF